MTIDQLSRRNLIIAAGGMAFTGSGLSGVTSGLEEDPLGKDLLFRTTLPRNGEPALENLVKSWITPVKHFYVRSHAPNPVIDTGRFRLSIEGQVRQQVSLSLEQLNRLKQHQVTATLTCAGNRRTEFNEEKKVGGVQWEAGAIGNAHWTGVSLADVLKLAGLQENARHVWFEGLDEIKKGENVIPFGGSIPIEKAMQTEGTPGALLAMKMNGEPLTADHGFPLRTVVPGYIGARSVKWLGRIIVSDQPSPNHYLAKAYKLVKSTDAIDWSESGPIYRYPINGAIATPGEDAAVQAGNLQVSGYVLPTGRSGTRVEKVLLSADGGKKWQKATLGEKQSDFCWQLWQAKIRVTPSTTGLLLRAIDSAGGFMPYRVPWNAKGYLQNSWYRKSITVS